MDIETLDRLRGMFLLYTTIVLVLVIHIIIDTIKIEKERIPYNIKKIIFFMGISYSIAICSDLVDIYSRLGNPTIGNLFRYTIQYLFGIAALIPVTLTLHKKL